MDYKEEYQKALERAKKGLPIDEVFPELKESEDERIRKFLVELVSNDKANNYNGLYNDRGVRFDDVLAYLEKQKERERIVPEREATDFEIEVHEIIAQARSDKRLADKDALEQFEKEASCALMWKAEKQKEQQPAEWSEEDIDKVVQYLHDKDGGMLWSKATEITNDILRMLRPQPHWKPSEEQMKALNAIADEGVLLDLFNDLLKLM